MESKSESMQAKEIWRQNEKAAIYYPEILSGGLADEGVLILLIDIQHPVVPHDGEQRQERRQVEPDLQLGLVAVGIGLVRGPLDGVSLAVAPRLVEHVHGAVGVERVRGPCVLPVLGLEEGGEGGYLVPPAHVPLQVQASHYRHLFSFRHAYSCCCCCCNLLLFFESLMQGLARFIETRGRGGGGEGIRFEGGRTRGGCGSACDTWWGFREVSRFIQSQANIFFLASRIQNFLQIFFPASRIQNFSQIKK